MSVRIQVVLDEAERAEFRRHARLEGQSLSGWLREAGRARIAEKERSPGLTDRESLAAFFARCDEQAGKGSEADWAEHKRVLERSIRQDLPEA